MLHPRECVKISESAFSGSASTSHSRYYTRMKVGSFVENFSINYNKGVRIHMEK